MEWRDSLRRTRRAPLRVGGVPRLADTGATRHHLVTQYPSQNGPQLAKAPQDDLRGCCSWLAALVLAVSV